jgi:hypothetical protein
MVQMGEKLKSRLSNDLQQVHLIVDIARRDVPQECNSGKRGKTKPDMIGYS